MMKKISSILLAVALVLSFSVVATPVSADQYAQLAANITAPMNGVNIMGGSEFTVSANVTNIGNWKAKDVMATIGITGNASLKAGQPATKSVFAGEFGENWSAVVNWTLTCTGAGLVSINVTPSGKDDGTLNDIVPSRLYPGTVSINQTKVLQVNIGAPNGTAFNVTNEFPVTANVTNISSLNATYVQLTISIDRYAQLRADQYATRTVVGTLTSGATSTNYTWILQCTGDGFSRITVSASGNVPNEVGEPKPIPAQALTPATVKVRQGDFPVANITLIKGWNLISLPLMPLKSTINVVLAGLDDVISVWYWAGRWYSFVPNGPSDLATMEDGKAYWIKMGANQTLQLAGMAMPEGSTQPPPAYPVVVGWNMVGFKNTADNVTAAAYLAGTEYVRIYGFNAGAWFTIPGPSYNTTMMVPGLGYWVAFTKPGTIYP
jgi:hypothetical protein